MSELQQDRMTRVQRAGHRLIAADLERADALAEVTVAIHEVRDAPVSQLAACTGLTHSAVHALLCRGHA